ncbi:type I glyceraldehyde-3-phosphate dehydrogenase [Paenibacillus sp. LMG 31456]|uniref:Type I glyceraldehyde-3-phosphate dehydrogenase n=1 Tax=Paenibacillus foliorum TaxID=2654974 RepID=A0A972K4T7_9BACL|nr:type I glyceraldehyde-3-phosphate dehydrogenase [Paenibacillus foliorum]NOU96352.1 type I glyceraldehyde-3-phosphate dehydrogenase [Paenibacillus foliorum]
MNNKIGISGMGRIGRLLVRKAFSEQRSGVAVSAINCSYPVETVAHLLKYDTIHGQWDANITVRNGKLHINENVIDMVNERDPSLIPWRKLGVDIAIDATGKFTDREGAGKHLTAGAEKVIITAPAKQADLTIVMGVNDSSYHPEQHRILSAASCTTNCVAPLLYILDRAFTVKNGWMTTVHSFTSDQNHMDNPHKDLRRARACTQSIIPTSTGVGRALAGVLPHLAPVIQGISIRVPTPDVSLVDLTVQLGRSVSYEEAVQVLQQAAAGEMSKFVGMVDTPLVSSDFIGSEYSAVIDGPSLMVTKDQMKVLAWYDNEWAYSCRVIDVAAMVANKIAKGAGIL